MRLGIRRKLIGTLVLVGLVPLALALVVILIGGARLRLRTMDDDYHGRAKRCAVDLADRLDEQLRRLTFIAALPTVIRYVRESDALRARTVAAGAPFPDARTKAVEAKWKSLPDTVNPARRILHNALAHALRLVTAADPKKYRFRATNRYGELLAADSKPSTYYMGDRSWWRTAYNGGRGQRLIGSVVAGRNGKDYIGIATPVIDPRTRRALGVIREVIRARFLLAALRRGTSEMKAGAQIVDTATGRTLISAMGPRRSKEAGRQYKLSRHRDAIRWLHALFAGPMIGYARVRFASDLHGGLGGTATPHWVVLISNNSDQAMIPIYKLASTIAVIGILFIALLFIVGLLITNREVIRPLIRLREAAAAVGRGELNVRLNPDDPTQSAFSTDELGELAHEFDNMTRQLQRSINQMARANEAKKRFMELAGHELRTPVTYILGVCELGLRQLQQAAQRDNRPDDKTPRDGRAITAAIGAMQRILGKTSRLNRIIDNLLKLVNNDQYTTRMLRSRFDPRDLILQVCNEHRPFIAERRQILDIDIPDHLPPFIGDRDQLEDVLTNLLSNAIRFSPDESTVRVAAHKVVGNMLEILVEDAGPGIPQQDLEHLFEPFYTGDDILHHHSGTFEYQSKGIGLGLAIVRRFVELHGGVVQANPREHGTQFRITLPLPGEGEVAPEPPENQVPALAARGAGV